MSTKKQDKQDKQILKDLEEKNEEFNKLLMAKYTLTNK